MRTSRLQGGFLAPFFSRPLDGAHASHATLGDAQILRAAVVAGVPR